MRQLRGAGLHRKERIEVIKSIALELLRDFTSALFILHPLVLGQITRLRVAVTRCGDTKIEIVVDTVLLGTKGCNIIAPVKIRPQHLGQIVRVEKEIFDAVQRQNVQRGQFGLRFERMVVKRLRVRARPRKWLWSGALS